MIPDGAGVPKQVRHFTAPESSLALRSDRQCRIPECRTVVPAVLSPEINVRQWCRPFLRSLKFAWPVAQRKGDTRRFSPSSANDNYRAGSLLFVTSCFYTSPMLAPQATPLWNFVAGFMGIRVAHSGVVRFQVPLSHGIFNQESIR